MIRHLDHDQPAHRLPQLFTRVRDPHGSLLPFAARMAIIALVAFVSILACVLLFPELVHLRGPP